MNKTCKFWALNMLPVIVQYAITAVLYQKIPQLLYWSGKAAHGKQ